MLKKKTTIDILILFGVYIIVGLLVAVLVQLSALVLSKFREASDFQIGVSTGLVVAVIIIVMHIIFHYRKNLIKIKQYDEYEKTLYLIKQSPDFLKWDEELMQKSRKIRLELEGLKEDVERLRNLK